MIFRKIFDNSLMKVMNRVKTLAFGILGAQLIGVLFSPFLTRLYSPIDFSFFAIFSTMVSVLLPSVSGRYDLAIVTLKDKTESDKMILLSFLVNIFLCCVLLLIIYINNQLVELWVLPNTLGWIIFLVPLALFLNGCFSTLKYVANRDEKYHIIGFSVFLQASIMGLTMLIVGVYWSFSGGMILSMIFGVFGALSYLFYFFRQNIRQLSCFSKQELFFLAKKYFDYPVYDGLASFLNSLALLFPVFVLMNYYPAEITGYYALLSRVALAPLSFISQSFSQVHLKKISYCVHAEENALSYLFKATGLLSLIVLPFFLILSLFSPGLFAFVFGESWREAGTLLTILMPSFSIKFVVSALSGVFAPTGNNILGASWKVLDFSVITLSYLTFAGHLNVDEFFRMMMLVDLLLYSIYYFLIVLALKNPRRVVSV